MTYPLFFMGISNRKTEVSLTTVLYACKIEKKDTDTAIEK